MKNIILLTTVSAFFFLVSACQQAQKKTTKTKVEKQAVKTPVFNADSAYHFIEKQVSFGPRVPNSKAHKMCAEYLEGIFKKFGADIIIQKAKLKAYDNTILDSRNIIAQYNVKNPNRIILCAHWDSRHVADQDPNPEKQKSPILGANDGASGVGVLMEIARHLSKKSTTIGIDFILFDAEDYGQPESSPLPQKENTWCLGSQYWCKTPHKKGYMARYGVLLDMVGAPNAQFLLDPYSIRFAENIVNKIWGTAQKLGYSDYFKYQETTAILDDHYYINTMANIPCVDIVHKDHTTESRFGKFWHTHKDNMSSIDKKTLKAVGQTLLELIYQEK